MIDIGRTHQLPVAKIVDFGVYLDAEELGTILLPRADVPDDCEVGTVIEAFIYRDSKDKLIATTQTPKVQVGECALLDVKDVNDYGAFLDWGLVKDLLVPYGEQQRPMEQGKAYVVFVYLDEYDDRIVATSRLSRHLQESANYYKPKQKVDLMICGKSDMGYKAIINNTHLGLIFKDDAFKPLKYGQKVQGYIKAIRDDRKIDLSLQLPSGDGRDDLSEQILQHLRDNKGISQLTDKSPPDAIYRQFNVSKKNYKKALGSLYKQKQILIQPDKITLV
ncbi:MAG: GntR family transcriptional regulator [Alteromonadaceae bacterium]|nr:MAG: GntR family transcriptional regulator [Alteromonadaceae bacterium]